MQIGERSAMRELGVNHAERLGLLFCMAQLASRECHCLYMWLNEKSPLNDK